MSKARKPTTASMKRDSTGDAAIGYGSPPKAYQFKPGQCGNPRGRPKGSRNLATSVRRLMGRSIPVTNGGRRMSMSVPDAILHRYLERALKGDIKAGKFLLDLHDRYGTSEINEAEASADSAADRAIMEAFAKRLKRNMR